MEFKQTPQIVIIGLGYVGLPLAVALAKHFPVMGFDINKERIKELQHHTDRTREITSEILKASPLQVTTQLSEIQQKDIYIVTVPTPVDEAFLPDLTALSKASETVGKALRKGSIVIYESTVYPGVTEEFCGPILEQHSGLKSGIDFFLGYSPERINPGDKHHTLENITKVVSGQTPIVAEYLRMIYGRLNHDNIFVAKNIKTAEAAKVIENAQRDINIAFVNEITTILGKLKLSIYDVLEAAETKWNFLKFQPGLVGGHCIGVDPYYLAYLSRQLEHEPEVILAGRRINESMGSTIAHCIHQELMNMTPKNTRQKILVLGLTFKENIPDLRNTKVIDLIHSLKQKGHELDIHDAMADPGEAEMLYNLNLMKEFPHKGNYDCIIGAVPHRFYQEFGPEDFQKLLNTNGLIADIKKMWKHIPIPEGISYWSL